MVFRVGFQGNIPVVFRRKNPAGLKKNLGFQQSRNQQKVVVLVLWKKFQELGIQKNSSCFSVSDKYSAAYHHNWAAPKGAVKRSPIVVICCNHRTSFSDCGRKKLKFLFSALLFYSLINMRNIFFRNQFLFFLCFRKPEKNVLVCSTSVK